MAGVAPLAAIPLRGCITLANPLGQNQNLESRAEQIARCNRTLTFILSLTGRGEERDARLFLADDCEAVGDG
jgi:hypothetical protein